MRATWTGISLCALVIYFGIVHGLSNPMLLLNPHATILVIGGTVAISFLTYSPSRIWQVMRYILWGFLFRMKQTEFSIATDLIASIEEYYGLAKSYERSKDPHPFLTEAFFLLNRKDIDVGQMQSILEDRRNAIKRLYVEDAKILNNIAKYPPHLGLLGAASGMIEMMSALGKSGVDTIGAAMAIALSATLWGVGLNNFVFLPLADNSMKSAEDELYMRDLIIHSVLLCKNKAAYIDVVRSCFNKMPMRERMKIKSDLHEMQQRQFFERAG